MALKFIFVFLNVFADGGPIKAIAAPHREIKEMEPTVRKFLKANNVVAGQFYFLDPLVAMNVEDGFTIIFPEKIKWRGHELPPLMSLHYDKDPDAAGPPGPYVNISRMVGTAEGFDLFNARCSQLTITESYVGCNLTKDYPFGKDIIPKLSVIAFPVNATKKKPTVTYIWTWVPITIFGKHFKANSSLKIEGNKVIEKSDENTDRLGFGLGVEH